MNSLVLINDAVSRYMTIYNELPRFMFISRDAKKDLESHGGVALGRSAHGKNAVFGVEFGVLDSLPGLSVKISVPHWLVTT